MVVGGGVIDTETVSLFLALLAVVAEVSVVVIIGLVLAGWLGAVTEAIGPRALLLAFCVAAVSMGGSLYFSEVSHFVPCRLCWYQRIAMYPLVPILGVAAWRRDRSVRPYALILSITGMVIAAYHVLLERYPRLESSVCELTNPCTLIWIKRLGYLTIPTMSLSAFALITTLLLLAHGQTSRS